ncbi:alpha-L-rhamnosidase-related protein [Aureibaculum luteum]|uniref:alpha-L-rhamnosidase-related protein n=1 Tax=Aureibaculum luteum TaxID=1548456 RepID=UPI000E4E1AFD|nr:alpha-L-rhamnosidase C-terminal domain-containing protein [Aureibaculum luteum]
MRINLLVKHFLLKNSVRFILVFILIICINCKVKADQTEVGNPIAPTGLTVENIRNTTNVKIVDLTPEFGWIIPSTTPFQKAYQIIVSSSKENSNITKVDVWDSGKVIGNESFNISFKGNALKEGQTYFWKVRIWDNADQESQYSEIQAFQTGSKINTITTANSFQMDSIKPIVFEEISKSSYFIDFGKAAFANILFHYNAKSNDTIIVRIGEQLDGNRINRNPQGTIRYQEIKIPVSPEKNTYILPIKPDKRNTKVGAIVLPDSFPVLMPFRYAEIENVKESIEKNAFTQLAFHSYWDDSESKFQSSDTILNQIWDLCKYSIKATTFAGVYVDGDRERIPYEADAYLNQLSHYTTDREYAMARQTIEYFMEHPTWPTEWQLHVALMFHADYMYTGNTELIERYYDDLKHKTLLELRREDGLISSSKATPEFMKKLGFKNPKDKLKDIVDWPPAQKDTGWKLATKEGERDGFVFTPINTVANCLYYRNLEIMIEFAQLLNKPKEVTFFKNLAQQVKTSINSKLLDAERGFYKDGEDTEHASLHSNMMALAFNIVPKENISSVAEFIKTRGMACSVYGSQYLLDALYNANESDYALRLLTSTENRSWYNMIRIGSTITLEAWDMKYKPNADWNHAWGATPANIIPRGLWGIQPKTPGFKIATIKPQLGNLAHSKIKVPTIHGSIIAEYERSNRSEMNYSIEIPGGMTAEFILPDTIREVYINNKSIQQQGSVFLLQSGKNTVKATF